MHQILHYNKENLHFINVKTEQIDITLCNLGASIYELKYNGDLMTLTTKKIKDFKQSSMYYGKTVGPFVNRIKEGKIELEGKLFEFDRNHFGNALHGSNKGVFKDFFDYTAIIEKDATIIVFHIEKEDYSLDVKYRIRNNQVRITFDAKANIDTLAAFSNHTFFSLNLQQLNPQTLQFSADKYLATDEALIPVEYKDLYEDIDFNEEKLLSDLVIDNSYHLTSNTITLKNEKYILKMSTDFEYAHVYTDNFKDFVDCLNTGYYKTRRAIAIQPEDDILNRVLLHKGEKYNRNILLTFDKNEESN